MTASTPERADLETALPALAGADYNITSAKDRFYNCIAWGAGQDDSWWQPGFPGGYYWPQGISQDTTLASYEAAYRRVGYRACDDGAPEDGFEKVVLYVKNAMPSHAARQLPDGRWTSKCGKLEDIDHAAPETVAGETGYGEPTLYMKRRVRENRPTAQELNIQP